MDPRLVGAIIAVAVMLTVTAMGWLTRDQRGPFRLLLIALWLLSLLRVYSASAFLWAGDMDPAVLALLRLATLSVATVILILLVTALASYIRRLRDD